MHVYRAWQDAYGLFRLAPVAGGCMQLLLWSHDYAFSSPLIWLLPAPEHGVLHQTGSTVARNALYHLYSSSIQES
jgi:hypothetical protein